MNERDSILKHDLDRIVGRYINKTATPTASFKRRNAQARRFIRRLGGREIF